MIGLYITILILISSFLLTAYLICEIFSEELIWKRTLMIILIIVGLGTLLQTLYVSFSNPGFYKPGNKDLANEENIKTLMVTIREQNIFLKYCKTCRIIKDLRVFHCKYCNLCVKRHDHHCPWLSICIGIKNHKKFLTLILISFVYLVTLISILSVILSLFDDNINKIKTLATFKNFNYSAAIVLLSLSGISTLFILLTAFFQTQFICHNETTSENIRRSDNVLNPFDKGCKQNMDEFLNNIEGYSHNILYNPQAKQYLMNAVLLTDYYNAVLLNKNNAISKKSSKVTSSEIEKTDNPKLNISVGSHKTSDKMMEE